MTTDQRLPTTGLEEVSSNGGVEERPQHSTLNTQHSTLTTRCGFCAYEFSEEEGEKTCGKCAHFGGCRMVMCPRCNYEMPQTPKLVKMIRQWLRRPAQEPFGG